MQNIRDYDKEPIVINNNYMFCGGELFIIVFYIPIIAVSTFYYIKSPDLEVLVICIIAPSIILISALFISARHYLKAKLYMRIYNDKIIFDYFDVIK